MENFHIVLIIFIIIIVCNIYMYMSNEGFTNCSSNSGMPQMVMVDSLACFPGTYWRNKSYQDMCAPVSMRRPMRMDVEGKPARLPEPRYEMVCNPDERGNRNCQMVKVYNKYV
jgi:hypothetical protein